MNFVEIIIKYGIGIFLTGVITSIILGVIKTPIHKALISSKKDVLTEDQYKRRENIFDTLVFLSTFVLAFVGAIIYYLIFYRAFDILRVLEYTMPVWLAQSLAYGFWKKFGIKRGLEKISKLFVKDKNKDGKITLDEAIAQVKDAYKDGKLDVNKLLADAGENAVENLPDVVEDMVKEVEVTPEMAAIAAAANGDSKELVDMVKQDVSDLVTATTNKDVVVADKKKVIEF